ncbi:helix-turn-helix domain-containing protein [Paenibacillus sp. NEAU-GSW1]|nr:helix-turn-helix domain-containing protein [Paenibacillus sp. NEAU-GSW1]
MVYPIMKAIARKKLDFDRFCQTAAFDPGLLRDAETRISGEELERLMNEAAAFTNDESFGLFQGRTTDISDMGILGYVMMHSETIENALKAYQRYNVILCSGANLEWSSEGGDIRLRFARDDGRPMPRHCLEDMTSSVYHLMGLMSNRTIPLLEVQFAHTAPADISPYTELFGVEPVFGNGESFLRFKQEVLSYPILYSDPKLRLAFEPIADEKKQHLLTGRTLSSQVFQWMIGCMPARMPTLKQTAEAFGMSTRSLQEKLKEEDASFNELSARVRKELAQQYLRGKEFSIGEIAYLLHYSEPSAFHNAFKKWTGLAPAAYRKTTGNG